MDADIVMDTAGQRFVTQAFFRLGNTAYFGERPAAKGKQIVCHPRQIPPGHEYDHRFLWVELVGGRESTAEQFCCPNPPQHAAREVVEKPTADLYGGRALTDFAIDVGIGHLVVTAALAARLKTTSLSGISLTPVAIKVNQSTAKPPPELFLLQGQGTDARRPMRVRGKPNVCPYCGRGWVVCEACGAIPWKCGYCGRETWQPARKPDRRKKALTRDWDPAQELVDVRRWDGSDLLAGVVPIVTKRVVDWLLAIHAGPIIATPVRACLDDATPEQLAKFRRSADLSTVEK